MHQLFWKTKAGKVISAIETPFKTEDEFENYIETAKDLLSGIFILKRQVRAGADIPDMVGIDGDNNVVVIENKNVKVDEGILPQLLRYALWAETHPDAIKAMWLEAKEQPKNLEIDWDGLKIRVVVLAPSIKLTVPRLVKKIGYRVDLIELKKFVVGRDEFIFVNKLEEPETESKRPTKGREVYDKAYYQSWANAGSVEVFFSLKKQLEEIVMNKGWNLETKFGSNRVVFKSGFFNVFGVKFAGKNSLWIFVKLPKGGLAQAKRLCPYQIEYEAGWTSIWIEITDRIRLKKLLPLLQSAYEEMSNEHF